MLGSTRGLSHRPLKAESRVRIPYRVPLDTFQQIFKAPFIKSSFAFTCECLVNRGVAQLVERDIWDVEAAGSRPVTPTNGWYLMLIESTRISYGVLPILADET